MSDRCPICGGQKTAGETTMTLEYGEGVLVVRHVPAQVCTLCGERWVDHAVAAYLQQVLQNVRQYHAEVEVVNWHRIKPAVSV